MSTKPDVANLISYWRLEEASGNRADAFGTNTLTDNNTVTSAAGKVGTAASFASATSESLSHVDSAELSITGALTILAWVNMTSLQTQDLVSKMSAAAGNYSYSLLYNHGGTQRFQFRVSSDGTAVISATDTQIGLPSTGTWYFLQGYHDPVADVIGLKISGNAANTAVHATDIFDGNANFRLGANDQGAYLNGVLDEVSLWNTVLTSDEHDWMYNAGSGREFSELRTRTKVMAF